MKKLAFGALFAGLLSFTACGGGDASPDAPNVCVGNACVDGGGGIDSTPPLLCNPVEQTGCEAGEKCTWITVVDGTQAMPDGVGLVGCVADGTAGIGEACTEGAPGEATGFDTCAAGGYCIRNVCQEVCTDVPDSCDLATSACGSYRGVFVGTTPRIGVCDFKCDPVDQTRLLDDGAPSGANCGQPANGGDPTRACYGYVDVDFTCAPVLGLDNTHYVDVSASPSLNVCAPGYGLLPLALTNPDLFVCMAYCRPQPTHSAQTNMANGGGGFTCASRQATAPANECRYWQWFDVIFGATNTPNPQNVDFGFCLDFAQHSTNETPPQVFASCTTLSLTDGPDDQTFPDAEEWGCMPQITAATAQGPSFRTHMRKLLGVTNQPVAPERSR